MAPRPTSSVPRPLKQSYAKAQIFIASALLLTTVVSFVILTAHVRKWSTSGSALKWIENHRSAVGIIVQVLSHLLGVIQLYVLRKLLRVFSSKIRYFNTRLRHYHKFID